MRLRILCNLSALFVIATFSYSAAHAQVVNTVKDAADKTKEVTVKAAKTTTSAGKTAGGYTVKVVDNVKGQTYEGGRWLVVTTWNGTKWVSKRTWFETKKAASATKDA